jgi:hypothetical protein
MIITNPYRERPTAIPGTRLLEDQFDLLGTRIPDPDLEGRVWEVQGVYEPIQGRALGGIRTKLVDQKNFVTFCNQRDLEFMLGLGKEGSYCTWADTEYVAPDDRNWCGFCCDSEDLVDDLFDREMFLRAQMPGGVLVPTNSIERRVHHRTTHDCEEQWVLISDSDPDTGYFPDLRLETLLRRWARAESVKVRWQ